MNSQADIQQALRSSDEETRREALQALRMKSLSEIRSLLFIGMADTSWRVRKESVDVFVAAEPGEDCITDLLELLRNEENAGLRNSAAEAITRLGVRAAAPLIRMLHDNGADVRKFVIDVMGAIGDPVFLPVLLSSLTDPDINVAAAAAEHLGNIGDSDAVPALVDSIIDNETLFFRFSALAALGKLTSHLPVPQEIVALAGQEILCKAVYECLGSIGDESVSHILVKGFELQQKSSRRAAIAAWYRIFSRASATARLCMENSVQNLKGSAVLPMVVESFELNEPVLAEAVTTLLGAIGDMRGVSTLLSAFANERFSGSALTSLKRLGAEGLETLVALYPQADETSRCAICTVIGELNYGAGGSLIGTALRDSSLIVRKAAVSAAGRLGMTESIPAIVPLLAHPDAEVKSVVASCLQALALIDPEAIQKVARNLATSDQSEKRRSAAILHAALGDGEALFLLVKDEDPGVRQTAVASIGRLHLGSNCSMLLIALVDEDPDVRIAAAEALGEIGGHDVIQPLIHALKDEDCWVQCAVLKTIARIDATCTLPAIKSLFPHADGLLMITCLKLLESIGNREAMELVEAGLDNPDKDIMSLSMEILARQGGEWVVSNAERLLSHPRQEIRADWADLLAGLPRDDARHFLSLAAKTEQNAQVKLHIQSLLERFA